jgi:hypothetical protein
LVQQSAPMTVRFSMRAGKSHQDRIACMRAHWRALATGTRFA